VVAYFHCRKRKRNTKSALQFEISLERNLVDLYEELLAGTYRPGKSICFVITHPKPREVWAADFRDRIVHHLLYNKIADRFHRRFIHDTFACIPERGTLYGALRLEAKVRSITQNWTVPAFYLKCDVANCFVSIDKRIVFDLLSRHIPEPWWRDLAATVLFHDCRKDFEFKGDAAKMAMVPVAKRLTCQPDTHGLPIGNLSSQFFLNVLLNELDQRVKHYIRARHYVRYVDDFIVLGQSTGWLEAVHHDIANFLPAELGLRLNESKTLIQPVDRGVDFVGQVIKPYRRVTRRRVVNHAIRQAETMEKEQLVARVNSYFGTLRQASHSHADRARLAKTVLRRGQMVDGAFTKTYKRKAA
jgi:hypothetical protein